MPDSSLNRSETICQECNLTRSQLKKDDKLINQGGDDVCGYCYSVLVLPLEK
jgi:hypothetical protein